MKSPTQRPAANSAESRNLRHNPATQDLPAQQASYYQETNAESICQVRPDCGGQQWVHSFMNLCAADGAQGVCSCPSYPSTPWKVTR